MLLQKFQLHIKNKNWFNPSAKLLLAVSGGRDSMVLADLLEKSGINFSAAHCNFCLRGEEASRDEEFVINYFTNKEIKIFTKRFSTKTFATENNLSIQMAARELRYNWFNQLMNENRFDYLITAHHLNDAIETFFINLLRGTGINGLKGIPEKQGNIIRPLLFASSDEIIKYQTEQSLSYVEDSSNKETKYLRNKLRSQVIPLLKEINPNLENNFKKEFVFLSDTSNFVATKIQEDLSQISVYSGNQIKVKLADLINYKFLDLAIHHLLQQVEFSAELNSQLKSMILMRQSGKKIIGKNYTCLIDRTYLIFKKNEDLMDNAHFFIEENVLTIDYPISLKFIKHQGNIISKSANSASLDEAKIKFPLQLRKWKNGDVYYPIGMVGKKKLSDFFVNNKYTHFEKEEQWLLTSGNEIVWIVGKRIDRRFMVSDSTKNTLEIAINE
jgi:tRNA(Ile)-lysidine synthase